MTATTLIAILVFLSVVFALMTLYRVMETRYRRILVTRRLLGGPMQRTGHRRRTIRKTWLHLARRAGGWIMPGKGASRSTVGHQLIHAGFRSDHAVAIYYGSKICLAAVLGLLYLAAAAAGGHITAESTLQIFFPLALGFYLPGLALKIKISRRKQQIFRELPDALDLLLICIEAGLSFDMALHRISRELAGLAPVLSDEFGRYFLEIRSGLPRRQVLQNLADRNDTPALTAVVNVLHQSSRFGTDVADALRVHIGSMRTERRQRAEEKGAKISTQLTFPLILLILPALLIIILGPAIINIMERLEGGF
ncbi:MAG: type II secretion system F family protein [Desulfatitalea sp.]|nr:type II secretion system F family protein [Desulfatitalea sp.]